MLLLLHLLFFFFRGKELLDCDFNNNNFFARIDDFLFVCVVFFGCCFSDMDFTSERKKSVVRNDEF
jgi:hypothetical protein